MEQKYFEKAKNMYFEVQKAVNCLAAEYVTNFGVGNEVITSVEYGHDLYGGFTDDQIVVYTEVSSCSCCSPDSFSYTIPVSYLWAEDWIEREKLIRELNEQERLRLLAEREEAEEQHRQEVRRAKYEELRKEFGGS